MFAGNATSLVSRMLSSRFSATRSRPHVKVGLAVLESCQARVFQLESLLESRCDVGGTLAAGMGSVHGQDDLRSPSSRSSALDFLGGALDPSPSDEPPLPSRLLGLVPGRSGQLQSGAATRTLEIEECD